MKTYNKKRLVVSDSVHKYIHLQILKDDKLKTVDDYLRIRLNIK